MSVKIAVAIVVVAIFSAASLALFYKSNRILEFDGVFNSNQALVRNAGIFTDENEYKKALDTPAFNAKRSLLKKASILVVKDNLLEDTNLDPAKLNVFFSKLEASQKSKPISVTVGDQDIENDATIVQALLSKMLTLSDSVDSKSEMQFRLKLTINRVASHLTNALDFDGTGLRMMDRLHFSNEIFEKTSNFRRSSASEFQKNQLIESCLTELRNSYDLLLMLRTEYLRLLELIDFAEGKNEIKRKTLLREVPKQLDLATRIKSKLPGFTNAWKSRLNQEFGNVIYEARQVNPSNPDYQKPFCGVMREEYVDKKSLEYINLSSFKFDQYASSFGYYQQYIFRLQRPQIPEPKSPYRDR